jgi:hypothetical protein
MSEKSIKLLTVIAGTFLGTAILLLVVDYQLKNSIIKEAETLRRILRAERYAGSNSLRNSGDDYWNGPFPSDMVGGRNARMEKDSPSKEDYPTADDILGRSNGHTEDGNS